ncbi:MAG: hypothetical protein AAFV33_01060 [Chloroflexota bacterium]
MFKRTIMSFVLVLTLTAGIASAQYGDDSPEARNVVNTITALPEFQQELASYPEYNYYIERNEDVWYLELFVESEDDELWLAVIIVDAETLEVIEVERGDGEDMEMEDGEDDENEDDEEYEEVEITPEIQAVIDSVAADEQFAPMLAEFPNYRTFVEEEEAGYLIVGFYVPGEDEMFLGEAFVQRSTMMIEGAMVARFLTESEIEARRPEILAIAQADMAVSAVLAELPAETTPYIIYEPLEQMWYVVYENGLETYEVTIGEPEDDDAMMRGLSVLGIENISEFEQAELDQIARDEAVALAFEAPAFEEIDLPDGWYTRITQLSETTYGVDFVTEDGTLIMQVVVDTGQNTIVEVVQ